MTYAWIVIADHEFYNVPEGWRLFAINCTNGDAYEMAGGFADLATAHACLEPWLIDGQNPAEHPGVFARLSQRAIIVAAARPAIPRTPPHADSTGGRQGRRSAASRRHKAPHTAP
jgi:hypothetical protein